MQLQKLELTGFRTYEKVSLDFDRRLTFVTGHNATGKTNLLEAISLLSLGKSFRGASETDMVRHGTSAYHIMARYSRHGQSHQLEMGTSVAGSLKRRIKQNGKALSGRSQLIGQLITVIFSPSDIEIVEGGPGPRRKYLDMVLSSRDPEYLRNLMEYNRALKQRNAILKRIKQNRGRESDLDAWEHGLIRSASIVTQTRLRFVEDFQSIFADSLTRISLQRDVLQLRLSLSADDEAADLAAALKRNRKRDMILGYTTVGPHRQNLVFERDGKDIMRFGSQGQKRSLVIALRIAQFFFLKQGLGLTPILLIDDVIRELDAGRRSAFVDLLQECGQAIFTTPDLEGMEAFIGATNSQSAVLKIVDPGQIERLS